MELTIITHTNDAGESHSVEVFRGDTERNLIGAVMDRYEELIGEFCDERGVNAGTDDRISEGAEVKGTWHETTNPDELDWRTGFIEWRFRESGDNYTIRIYGDRSRYVPVVKERRIL